ncbi:hypothetical protein EPYR_01375 [Erwinia pyrifoliae DSM 12163]|nr:hypothetical protein EPYR_01375 [Erwinia pyrifoliae DSM 12163]
MPEPAGKEREVSFYYLCIIRFIMPLRAKHQY